MAKEKSIRELEDLPGIGEATADKLRNAGFDTLEKIATASPHDLAEISGISTEAAKKAVQAAKESTTVEYQTGQSVYEKRQAIGRITTGSKGLFRYCRYAFWPECSFRVYEKRVAPYTAVLFW